ncbi:hypothetical protein FN846DRAFT_889422 [Sphaerosporella brunnea]|uniref:Uncharacterized protein n=1 Tax=Sphaerosporella brunnea TaxID=1250544 RepID=A0A5J5EZI7_9PEZI|nr:hypothetical protein FN846DRAFT_889422 [Sphaerosporella brunnea]
MDGTCQYHWCTIPFPKATMAVHMMAVHNNYWCHGETRYVPVRYENGQALRLCPNECVAKPGVCKTQSGALAHQARVRRAGMETDANHADWRRNKPPLGFRTERACLEEEAGRRRCTASKAEEEMIALHLDTAKKVAAINMETAKKEAALIIEAAEFQLARENLLYKQAVAGGSGPADEQDAV